MSLALPNTTNVPPGGWFYTVPETGARFTGANYPHLESQIIGHYHVAGVEAPSRDGLFQRVQEGICAEHPDYCGAAVTVNPSSGNAGQHVYQMALQCLRTLIAHLAGSGERVTQEHAERRAGVCVTCPQNQILEGCSRCNMNTITVIVSKIVGAKKTSVDDRLRSCAVCHCTLRAKIWVRHSAAWNHMPEKQRKQLPPHCWLVTEKGS